MHLLDSSLELVGTDNVRRTCWVGGWVAETEKIGEVFPQEFEITVLSSRARLVASPVVRNLDLKMMQARQ